MPAQRIPHPQRRLEIHGGQVLKLAQGGERERLARHVRGKTAIAERGHRQTYALHADAVAERDACQIQSIHRDREAHVAAEHFPLLEPSDVLNDSGKHALPSPRPQAQPQIGAEGA